jgi:hypothetical protein
MRWTGKAKQPEVLNALIKTHQIGDTKEKLSMLADAIKDGDPRHWWYRILKSHCSDYQDGAIVGYEEPIHSNGLQGLKETDHGYVFFKKADIQYLGMATMRWQAVKALAEARPCAIV